MAEKNSLLRQGVIDSRKFPCCGHHEVGLRTREGEFRALQPGTWIQIMESREELPAFDGDQSNFKIQEKEEEIHSPDLTVWLPPSLRGDLNLRLKYGVLINKIFNGEGINGDVYQAAYLAKLRQLVTRAIDIPLPVTFDRFFTAPHLASGNPRQVAKQLWNRLEEIRRPVMLMQAWLNKQDEEHFAALIHPLVKADYLSGIGVDDFQIQKELEALTLETFFELLS